MLKSRKITHNEIELLFTIPNSLNNWRAESFATKEPETLEWIDSLKEGSVVWDIGANIGLYSCYAAKKKNCKVFAFEPSIFNLELLARNIYINGLTDNIVIVPLPLTNKLSTSTLNMSSTMWGGALSTFGESYGQDGKTINKKFEFNTLGISMLDAVNLLKIPQPDYIKIDVDGIEHLILEGGIEIIKNVKGLIIEIQDDFLKQATLSEKYLTMADLKFVEKKHASFFDNSEYKHCYNQIWIKK